MDAINKNLRTIDWPCAHTSKLVIAYSHEKPERSANQLTKKPERSANQLIVLVSKQYTNAQPNRLTSFVP